MLAHEDDVLQELVTVWWMNTRGTGCRIRVVPVGRLAFHPALDTMRGQLTVVREVVVSLGREVETPPAGSAIHYNDLRIHTKRNRNKKVSYQK